MRTFSERVLTIALSIPRGRVATYGAITRAAGGGARAAMSVTAILGKAHRQGAKIPFHRIVYSDGRVWLDARHRAERLALYKKEGIAVDAKGRIKNFRDIVMQFK